MTPIETDEEFDARVVRDALRTFRVLRNTGGGIEDAIFIDIEAHFMEFGEMDGGIRFFRLSEQGHKFITKALASGVWYDVDDITTPERKALMARNNAEGRARLAQRELGSAAKAQEEGSNVGPRGKLRQFTRGGDPIN